jgi:hypothetical protein
VLAVKATDPHLSGDDPPPAVVVVVTAVPRLGRVLAGGGKGLDAVPPHEAVERREEVLVGVEGQRDRPVVVLEVAAVRRVAVVVVGRLFVAALVA